MLFKILCGRSQRYYGGSRLCLACASSSLFWTEGIGSTYASSSCTGSGNKGSPVSKELIKALAQSTRRCTSCLFTQSVCLSCFHSHEERNASDGGQVQRFLPYRVRREISSSSRHTDILSQAIAVVLSISVPCPTPLVVSQRRDIYLDPVHRAHYDANVLELNERPSRHLHPQVYRASSHQHVGHFECGYSTTHSQHHTGKAYAIR